MKNLAILFLLFVIYSFLGWVMEVLVVMPREKKFVNRGFLIGPWCPIYGTGTVLMILFLDKYKQDIPALFIMATVICSILEYLTSYVMEKVFKARWWDYSERKFQINGRVCLEGALVFGLFSMLLVMYIHPAIESFFDRHLNLYQQLFLSGGLMALFIADLFVTVRHILTLNGRLEKLQKTIEKARLETNETLEHINGIIENTKESREQMKPIMSKIKFQDKRLLNAFPKLKSTKYNEALESLKELKNKKKKK